MSSLSRSLSRSPMSRSGQSEPRALSMTWHGAGGRQGGGHLTLTRPCFEPLRGVRSKLRSTASAFIAFTRGGLQIYVCTCSPYRNRKTYTRHTFLQPHNQTNLSTDSSDTTSFSVTFSLPDTLATPSYAGDFMLLGL